MELNTLYHISIAGSGPPQLYAVSYDSELRLPAIGSERGSISIAPLMTTVAGGVHTLTLSRVCRVYRKHMKWFETRSEAPTSGIHTRARPCSKRHENLICVEEHFTLNCGPGGLPWP